MRAPPIAKLVLSPSVLLIGACVYGYIVFTIYLSFTASTLMPVTTWVGPEAYRRLFGADSTGTILQWDSYRPSNQP